MDGCDVARGPARTGSAGRAGCTGHHGHTGMTRAAAVRTCAGAALRGALAWAVPAGLAGMTWASHYSVWEWAVWRAEGLRLPLPPPFPVWLVGNLAWPWHILEYSPWWPELGLGPARWPAHLWHDYAARAWQAPAAGAVPGALPTGFTHFERSRNRVGLT